jgi:hypothetical protein
MNIHKYSLGIIASFALLDAWGRKRSREASPENGKQEKP